MERRMRELAPFNLGIDASFGDATSSR